MATPNSRRSKNRTQTTQIAGLQDFLKNMGVLPAQMKRAESVFQTLAAATVIATAKTFAAETGRQQVTASQDLRAMGEGTVQYGGKAWSFGAEFGSILYGQFPEWRGNKEDAGYFLWPAIREFRDEDMLNLWVKEVWSAVEGLFAG